ncbi:hypothetical protein ABT168_02805 [Streptomyces sp. NPDC001793]|uniref:hypothetical protein n=1 Tax=Streptomyces sp. NPDC001793 TaxID=3154657 RepID=UPI0033232076
MRRTSVWSKAKPLPAGGTILRVDRDQVHAGDEPGPNGYVEEARYAVRGDLAVGEVLASLLEPAAMSSTSPRWWAVRPGCCTSARAEALYAGGRVALAVVPRRDGEEPGGWSTPVWRCRVWRTRTGPYGSTLTTWYSDDPVETWHQLHGA